MIYLSLKMTLQIKETNDIIEVKNMATKKPRFSITVPEELLKKIDDYRFNNRIASRAEAVIRLIEMGFDVLEQETKETAE